MHRDRYRGEPNHRPEESAQAKSMQQTATPPANVSSPTEGGLLTFSLNVAGLQEMIRTEIHTALQAYAPKEATATNEPRYYTRGEVGSMLHVSLTTLTKWRQAGTLTPVKIGGRTLYPCEAVKKALQTMRGKR